MASGRRLHSHTARSPLRGGCGTTRRRRRLLRLGPAGQRAAWPGSTGRGPDRRRHARVAASTWWTVPLVEARRPGWPSEPDEPRGSQWDGRVAGEAAGGRLGLEPGPGLPVLAGPGEPGPAAGRVAPDPGQPAEAALELLPQPVPARAHTSLTAWPGRAPHATGVEFRGGYWRVVRPSPVHPHVINFTTWNGRCSASCNEGLDPDVSGRTAR